MRTKTLLCMAALAAGVATSMAQSNVYSLNVVGYVNTVIPGNGAYSMIANPLNKTNNAITAVFNNSQMRDGATILRWDPVAADFQGTTYSYSTFLNAWDASFTLNPGEGIFFVNNDALNITNTFVGEVIQGNYTNSLLGSGSYNAVASSAPIGGSFTNAIAGIVPADSDTVARWDVVAQDLDGNSPQYSTFLNAWSSSVNIGISEGFFYIRNGANHTWVRNFTVAP